MAKVLKERKDVDLALTWDLSAIYATDEKFQSAVKEMKGLSLKIEKDYKGKLNTENKINECLDELIKLYQYRDLTSSYVELSVWVDYANNENQDKYSKIINIISDIESRLSFIESEIIQANDEVLDVAISESKENSNYLKDKKEKRYMRFIQK